MVVQARDLADAAQGYGSDDEDLLPLDADQPMPDGEDDAALSDPEADESASTDEPATTEEQQALTEEVWKQRESELAAQHNQQLAQLRSVKDRETQGAHQLRQHASARENVVWQSIEALLTAVQNGDIDPQTGRPVEADPRILYKMRRDLDQVQQQAMSQQQQQAQQGQSWVQQQLTGHKNYLAQLSKDEQGRLLFKPEDMEKDPDVVRAFEANIRAGGTQATWDNLQRTLHNKQAQAMVALATGANAKKRADKARANGTARGVQNTGRGGGAAPLNKDAAWEVAQKLYPTDLDARSIHYEKLITQHRLQE